ncbi:UDP-glycosyltransferase 91D1 [Dichanthelium oligosanthes]|uniref:UDP-glycosyltransferase 91D1 n=1 Tax=Dichanthelium oligosanthes TaxID=888268 RepID=A0A1E5UT32_9POAL|nr:UDP-glycosyltransferase 91D1 [Dichanthelium oligosanthes]
MLPYLELAERLASRGHCMSFVSRPRNLVRLPPRRHAVDLVAAALPLPRVEGLPDGTNSTNDVPYDKSDLYWKAFDGLAAPFVELLGTACADNEGTMPDWVIADCFHHRAATIALDHKVPCAMLLQIAAMIAAFAQSCSEWEPEAFPVAVAVAVLGKPLVHLGLLPLSPDGGRRSCDGGEDATVRWLDAQPTSLVVYVALGSEVPLSVQQAHELALGLELAGARFLWALRKPSGATNEDILPPCFRECTHDHGLVIMGWVPQMTVLAHAVVGAFLTHCGRNSLIEGLMFGHPVVMLPIFGDQWPNACAMEGMKVGLQVARDEDDGSFDREGLGSVVRAVMLEEEARKVFVTNALKMQEIVADRNHHERYIDEFIRQLRSYTTDGNSSTYN